MSSWKQIVVLLLKITLIPWQLGLLPLMRFPVSTSSALKIRSRYEPAYTDGRSRGRAARYDRTWGLRDLSSKYLSKEVVEPAKNLTRFD